MKVFRNGHLLGAALLAGALSLSVASATEMTYTGPSATIGDSTATQGYPGAAGAPGVSVVNPNLPAGTTVNNIKVEVSIDHNWVGDLKIELEHAGTTRVLMDRPGRDFQDSGAGDMPYSRYGSGHRNVRGYFTASGGTPLNSTKMGPTGNGLTTGTAPHQPLQSISTFIGTDASGPWTVTVTDYNRYDGRSGSNDGRINLVRLVLDVELAPSIEVNPQTLNVSP